MSSDANQESEGLPRQAEGDSHPSDFEDPVLRRVLHVEPPPRLPGPGERFGGPEGRRYEVLGQVGRGAMGQVFRARDEVLHRTVALKFLAPRTGLAEEALREARAVARLDHENIVRIFDVSEWCGTPGGTCVPFLVMEYLEGESLAALLRRHRPGLKQALDILGAVAEGLTHAHERHLIHRDLKPSNIFLTRQGTVKLLDFGLCHRVAASGPDAPHLPTAGTPAYMAPEQWRGEPQDTRTDIWAAGVVLFEMLAGTLPFPASTLEALREWVTSAEPTPPVRACRPDIPPEVEPLLATALAKDPARRFPSARELREEVRELRGRLLETGHEVQPATALQRRQVTLVSCVLTRLEGAGAPPAAEDPGELEAAFHETCARTIHGHGGAVPLCLGDEVLACFGRSQVREDDSQRAVRAGLELVGSVGAALPGMAVKVGIHTDMVALDEQAPGQRGGGLVIRGQAPKVAAWLAGQARPGEVLLGETTWKSVRETFEATALGPRTFEGLLGSLSVSVHRVSRERDEARFERMLAADGGLTPLVGRSAELGWLLSLWEQAQRGQGAFVLVSGEAGIGKSRLIRELGERIPAESATRVRFQCWSRPGTTAHQPLQRLLEALFQLPPGEEPRARAREWVERLEALGASEQQVRLIGLLLGLPTAQDSPVHQLTPERRREKTFEALVDLTLRMARQRPLLVFVADLHWADASVLEILSCLLERIERERVLVVFSTRPELRLGWARRPWLHVLSLDRLPAEQAAALVRETARGRQLPEDTVQALVKRTDGIPLFIREMTRMVLEGGTAASIPVTLHELLLARLDMLPSRQKSLLQLCAVVGRDVTRELLSALSERDEAALRRELAGLVEAGFLREEGTKPTYQFRYALTQEVAAQSLTRGARRQHHRKVARVLKERFPEVVEARPEVLAYHHAEAGEPESALPYQVRAGQLASQRSALREAVSHFTRALELLRGLPHAERLVHEELRILLALGPPLTHLRGYRAPEVERTYARARKLLHRAGDALPELDLSPWGPFTYYLARGEFRQAHELAGLLVELGERHHDRVLLILGHRMKAAGFVAWGRMREALDSLEGAMACARFELEQHRRIAARHGTDPWTTALAYAALIHSVRGQPEEARRYSRGALEMASHIGHAQTTAYVLTYVAMGSQYRHEPEPTLAWAEQLHALTNERSFLIWGSWATILEGWARAQLGQPREGLALIARELASWKERGIRLGVPSCLAMLAEIHLKLGQLEEGLAAVHEARAEQNATGERTYEAELYRVEGELLRATGRERKAKSRFLHAIETAHAQDAGLFELRATLGLCRLLRDMGRLELARQVLQRARTRFGEHLDSPDHREASALMKELMEYASLEARG